MEVVTTKVFEISSIKGEVLKFHIKTLLSSWDLQQVEDYYLSYMKYDESVQKFTTDTSQEHAVSKLIRATDDAHLLYLVEKVEGLEFNQENKLEVIKKALLRSDLQKLLDEIQKVIEANTVSDTKKRVN